MDVEIDKIKRKLLVKYPFFGSIVANLNYIENKECTTMGTDGENIYYNSEFLDNLTEDEQTFLFAHEVCHVAFEHIARSEGKDKRVWNIAADAVINAFLQKDGLPIVKGAVNMPNAINYNVEELYEKLLKEKKEGILEIPIKNKNNFSQDTVKQNNNNQNNENEDSNTKIIANKESEEKIKSEDLSSNCGEKESDTNACETTDKTEVGSTEQIDQPSQFENDIKENQKQNDDIEKQNQDFEYDNHSMWEDAIRKRKQLEENKEKIEDNNREKGENKIEESNPIIQENKQIDKSKFGREKERNDLEDAIKNISKIQEIDAFVQNSTKKKENLDELKRALARKAIGAEKTTISANRRVNNIGNSKTKIDWRYLLREAINSNIDWSYKNASIENGVLTPHIEDLPQSETEILLDTSGSVSENLLRNFLRECKHILKTSKVKVGCFDTKFYGFQEIRTKEDIENMKFVGHGLTNFYTAVNAFSRGAENKIIFTDGRGIIPEKSMNIIWVIFGDMKIRQNGGKVIYISNEQLKKLYTNL